MRAVIPTVKLRLLGNFNFAFLELFFFCLFLFLSHAKIRNGEVCVEFSEKKAGALRTAVRHQANCRNNEGDGMQRL